jgi:serine/threonine protein kinase
MTLAAGTHLGRYEIRAQIGAGGMGEVYLAQDTELERAVALKILPAEVTSDQQRMNRFVQEAKAASALNHQNIITIHEIGRADSARFIVMEFIDGETLRQHLTSSRMNLPELLDIAIQIASALSAAHQAGIAHRDLKADNVMVRRDGHVKVLDFGLAKLTERQSLAADTEAPTRALVNTGPGMIMGTAAYMSPEQARGQEVDTRTDIWSLGVVLYEMVTGKVPFAGSSTNEIISAILSREQAAPLARFAHDIPDRLEEIVTKALTKDREERYQHVKDLLIDLKRLKQKLEVEAEIERSVTPDLRTSTATATPRGNAAAASTREPAAQTRTASAGHPTTSAEYIVSGIKRHKTGAITALAALVVVLAVAVTSTPGAAAEQPLTPSPSCPSRTGAPTRTPSICPTAWPRASSTACRSCLI